MATTIASITRSGVRAPGSSSQTSTTPAVRHEMHGNMLYWRRSLPKSNGIAGTKWRNGMQHRSLYINAAAPADIQTAVSPETTDAETTTLMGSARASDLSRSNILPFQYTYIQPTTQINGPLAAELSNKIGRILDEFMQFMPVIGIDANDLGEHRQILESLETQIYIMDKVVEDGQSTGTPWDIDDMVLRYKGDMVSAGAWKSPAVRAMTHHITTYFQLETDVLKSDRPVDLETIRRVWAYRSNDLRLLMLVASAAIGRLDEFEEDDDMHEILDEICSMKELAMDLKDYEEDVTDDSFNTIRLFSQLYGHEKALENLEVEIEAGISRFEKAAARLPRAQQRAARAVMERSYGAIDLQSVAMQKEANELCAGEAEYYPLRPAHPSVVTRGSWTDRMYSSRVTTA